MRPDEAVDLGLPDFWVKIVDFLQQNWAAIHGPAGQRVTVYFVSDASRVFDEMSFESHDDAVAALTRNGFRLHAGDATLAFLTPPSAPFYRGSHPNGPIYSSGRFWRS